MTECEATGCKNQKVINDVEKDIYGNGKPGIKYDLVGVKIKTNVIMGLQVLILGVLAKIAIVG